MAAHDILKSWLADREIKPAEFARRVEYDRSNLHRLLNGRLRPSLDLALKIERETEGALPMSAWAEAA